MIKRGYQEFFLMGVSIVIITEGGLEVTPGKNYKTV